MVAGCTTDPRWDVRRPDGWSDPDPRTIAAPLPRAHPRLAPGSFPGRGGAHGCSPSEVGRGDATGGPGSGPWPVLRSCSSRWSCLSPPPAGRIASSIPWFRRAPAHLRPRSWRRYGIAAPTRLKLTGSGSPSMRRPTRCRQSPVAHGGTACSSAGPGPCRWAPAQSSSPPRVVIASPRPLPRGPCPPSPRRRQHRRPHRSPHRSPRPRQRQRPPRRRRPRPRQRQRRPRPRPRSRHPRQARRRRPSRPRRQHLEPRHRRHRPRGRHQPRRRHRNRHPDRAPRRQQHRCPARHRISPGRHPATRPLRRQVRASIRWHRIQTHRCHLMAAASFRRSPIRATNR